MKILHTLDRFSDEGGVDAYLISLLPILASLGHEVSVACMSYKVPYSWSESIPVTVVHSRDDLLKQVKKSAPDIVHTHGWPTSYLLEELAYIDRPRIIVHNHDYGYVCPGTQLYWRKEKKICCKRFGFGCILCAYTKECQNSRYPTEVIRKYFSVKSGLNHSFRVDRFIANSAYMKEKLIKNNIADEKIEVLGYFTDLEYDPNLKSETAKILYVGRLADSKGLDLLVKVLEILKDRKDWSLDIAGDGYSRQGVQLMVEKQGLTGRVRFLGWLNEQEKHRAFHRASVVVVPSRWPEAFGIVGIEAMACGRPVVAFDVGGISDWLDDGVTGYLIHPYDIEGFAEGVAKIIDGVNEAGSMGANAVEKSRVSYHSSGHIESLLNIYSEALL